MIRQSWISAAGVPALYDCSLKPRDSGRRRFARPCGCDRDTVGKSLIRQTADSKPDDVSVVNKMCSICDVTSGPAERATWPAPDSLGRRQASMQESYFTKGGMKSVSRSEKLPRRFKCECPMFTGLSKIRPSVGIIGPARHTSAPVFHGCSPIDV